MKRLIFIVFCLFSIQTYCQKIDSLIQKIKEAIPSWNKMRLVLSTLGTNYILADTLDKYDEFYFDSYPVFRDARIYFKSVDVGKENGQRISGYMRVVYDKKKILFTLITCKKKYNNAIDTLFRYIDERYLSAVLYSYNSKNKTNYTWKNLFEDDAIFFTADYMMFEGYDNPFTEVLQIVKKRDHAGVRNLCYSLNPIRKTFGAVALLMFKIMKEDLTMEEKQLLRKIKRCKQKINFSEGCFGSKQKISALLKENRINNIYNEAIGKGFL